MNEDSSSLRVHVFIEFDENTDELELDLLEAFAGELIRTLLDKE